MIDSTLHGDGSLWRLIKTWWWALLLAAFVAGIAGYAIATKLPKTYESTVTMLVGPINTDASLDASGSLTATYESLATSQPVLQEAISATHAKLTVPQLQTAVTTTSNTVSRLVTVTVSSRDPALASNLANALAKRIAQLANTTPEAQNVAITTFDQEAAVQALTNGQRIAVEDALRRVIGVSPAGIVTVVNPAIPAKSAASPKKSLIAILAALAGLAIAAIVLLIRMSKRSAADERSLVELEHTYLGEVDVSPSRDPAVAVAVEARPTSKVAADYRMLAARLSLVESTTRSLLVLDSTDGSAAAVVAANLAAALGEGPSESVILADVSTEGGGASKLLGVEGYEGYAELIGAPDLDSLNGALSAMFVTRLDQVSVLASGVHPPPRTLSPERARMMLRRLRKSADLVVLAGPPMQRSPSALTWARAAESVLFVVDGNKVSNEEMDRAIRDLTLTNTRFLGTVIGRRRSTLPMVRRPVLTRT